MTISRDQRICIKFCFKLERSCVKTIESVWGRVYGQNRQNLVRFKNGRTSVDSDPHTSRLSSTITLENIEHVRLAIVEDRRLNMSELESDLGIKKLVFRELYPRVRRKRPQFWDERRLASSPR